MAALAACLAASPAFGQTVPDSVRPGQIEKRFERPEEPERAPTPDLPTREERLPPEEARAIRFVLAGVVIEGSTVYEPADFAPLYEDLLAREISLADVYAVAEALVETYREDGYLLTEALVPPQQVEFGTVRIQIIESYVDEVVISGEVEGPEDRLSALARKIAAVRPIRRNVLHRYVLLMNDLPGVTATPALVPAPDDPGAYTLVVEVEHKTLDAAASVDNRGSRLVGPFQGTAAAALNSLLGRYERAQLFAATAGPDAELYFLDGSYEETVGNEGTRLSAGVSYHEAYPGGSLKNRDLFLEGLQVRLVGSHPVIRAVDQFLALSARLEYAEFLVEEDERTSSEDRLRVARLGASYIVFDEALGTARLDAELSQGFDILGASDPGSADLSRPEGRSDFTKLSATASHIHDLGSGWSTKLATSGQLAFSDLLASELFGFGGALFGRAYDPSEITGDHGVALSAELRYDLGLAPGLVSRPQIYVYYDRGHVWLRSPGAGEERHESAAAAGGGIRYRIAERVTGYFEVAKPLTLSVAEADPGEGKDLRVFFQLVAEF